MIPITLISPPRLDGLAARWRYTAIAHHGRALLGPVADTTLRALLAPLERAGLRQPVRVVDVGCGKGEMLVRAIGALGGSGTGVEPNPVFAEAARERIAAAGLEERVGIIESVLADSLLLPHSFSLALCTGSTHAFGDWTAALEGLERLLAPGGWAIAGPGYWKQTPDPAYLTAIGAQGDEMLSLLGTLAAARARGWEVEACHESTLAEWEDYERGYAANVHAWCDAHRDDPDARGFRERIEGWSQAYVKWGRATMGYALILMRRP